MAIKKSKVEKEVKEKEVKEKKEKSFKEMSPLERVRLHREENKIGRPTKFREEMLEIILEKMSEGYSKNAVAGFLGISEDTLYRWIKEIPSFSETIKQGEKLCLTFWEQKGIDHVTHYAKSGKQLNATAWIFNMKNRFHWTDKKEIDIGEKTLPVIKLAYNLEEELDEDSEEEGEV